MIYVIRAVFVLAVVGISFSYATTPEIQDHPHSLTLVSLIILIPAALAVVVMVLDATFQNKSLAPMSGLFFGLVGGIVMAYVLGMVVDLIASVFVPPPAPPPKVAEGPARPGGVGPPPVRPAPEGPEAPAVKRELESVRIKLTATEAKLALAEARLGTRSRPVVAMIKLLVGVFTIYFSVSFVMQTKDDFRFVIPYLEFSRQTKGSRPLLLDTSVIIDGRIADIADTRILTNQLVVPRFVLEELQDIADSSDKLRRNRGRRGLDMLNRLQGSDKIDIRLTNVSSREVDEAAEVDQKLVALAQHMDGRIVTNDYNLNKIAQLRGVEVININDLANALKPVVLPGESLHVKIIKPGEEIGQGIGYLDDGTMVVVEHGRDHIGREMSIVVTSTLQTSAGRMIFGRLEGVSHPGPRDRTHHRQT